MKTNSAARRGPLRLMMRGVMLAQGIAAALAALAAVAQVIPAPTATNAARVLEF